jgi:hypothetical protein
MKTKLNILPVGLTGRENGDRIIGNSWILITAISFEYLICLNFNTPESFF